MVDDYLFIDYMYMHVHVCTCPLVTELTDMTELCLVSKMLTGTGAGTDELYMYHLSTTTRRAAEVHVPQYPHRGYSHCNLCGTTVCPYPTATRASASRPKAMAAQSSYTINMECIGSLGTSAVPTRCPPGYVRHERDTLRECNHSIRLANAPFDQLPGASNASTLKIAIATLFVPYSHPCAGVGCALLLWCSAARTLQRSLAKLFGLVDIVAIMPAADYPVPSSSSSPPNLWPCGRFSAATELYDATDCPGLRIVTPRQEMVEAAAQHVARRATQMAEAFVLWKQIGTRRPKTGTEIMNAALSATLAKMLEAAPRRSSCRLSEDHAYKLGLTGLSPDSFVRAASTYLRPSIDARARDRMSRLGPTLWKWELLRLGEYDAVLFTDIDVDLLPKMHEFNMRSRGAEAAAATVASYWQSQLPPLVERARARTLPRLRIVGTADSTTPFNAGTFWLFPPSETDGGEALYADGLRVLRAPYNTTHGWALEGSPKQLFAERVLRHPHGSTLTFNHKPAVIDDAEWTFSSADVEQGFFLYVLWARHDVGAYAKRPRAGPRVWHYVKGGALQKPWIRTLTYKPPTEEGQPTCTRHALEALDHITSHLPAAELDAHSSACARAYRDVRDALEAQGVACCPRVFGDVSVERFFRTASCAFQPHELTDIF